MSFDDAGKDADLDQEYRRLMPSVTWVPRDEPTALDLANAWVLRDQSFRSIAKMERHPMTNRCTVVLRGKLGEHTSTTQLTFDSALRTALMVATWAGDK